MLSGRRRDGEQIFTMTMCLRPPSVARTDPRAEEFADPAKSSSAQTSWFQGKANSRKRSPPITEYTIDYRRWPTSSVIMEFREGQVRLCTACNISQIPSRRQRGEANGFSETGDGASAPRKSWFTWSI
jgi:hypothetical protein